MLPIFTPREETQYIAYDDPLKFVAYLVRRPYDTITSVLSLGKLCPARLGTYGDLHLFATRSAHACRNRNDASQLYTCTKRNLEAGDGVEDVVRT